MVFQKVIFVLFVAAIAASGELEDDSQTTTITRKERFLLATMKFRNRICGNQGNQEGVCKSWKDCWVGRGKTVGSCSLGHGVCCQYVYTCGNSTSERLSYFTNPTVIPPTCTLRVNVYDRRVTQLRLDFETFRLSQPTKQSRFDTQAYFCRNDTFTVTTSAGLSGNLGFLNLCGNNDGQHIYVPVNATLGPASVDLTFNTVNRETYPDLSSPQWKIKITQIDCCAPDTRDLCAPDGCLQYYPAPSGTFESFNYNGGMGHYQGLLNYAICFKRYNNFCSIQYNAVGFQLASNTPLDEYGTGCYQPVTNVNEPASQDYLFIPDATTSTNVRASLWCGTSLLNNLTTTNAPGPMYVFFHTDAYEFDVFNGPEIGFRINYQESSSRCYNSQVFFG